MHNRVCIFLCNCTFEYVIYYKNCTFYCAVFVFSLLWLDF